MPLPDKELRIDLKQLSVTDFMFMDWVRRLRTQEQRDNADIFTMIAGLGRIAVNAGNWTFEETDQIKGADLDAFMELVDNAFSRFVEDASGPPQEKPSNGIETTSATPPPDGSDS